MPAETRDARERERQALRLRRYGMATATSLMVIALLWIAYGFGDLTWRGVTHGTALILFWVALFYVLLRSGINLRLSDPSLTVPKVSASIVTMAYIMYSRIAAAARWWSSSWCRACSRCSGCAPGSCCTSPRSRPRPTASWWRASTG